MAGVRIGEKAKILPNSVVLPNTQVPAGETWGGVPAQKISQKNLVQSPSGEMPILFT
jgi:serine acetyltransferase